jgi:type I restriction enzyme R subunit
MQTPSFLEEHISQIPALQWLMKLGWKYLSPDQALEMRGGRTSNVLLEGVMREQLHKINSIHYKGKAYAFSEENIQKAILAMRELPVQDGYLACNKAFYDLLTLGKSLEQSIAGDKKSFSFQYINWQSPEENVYHVTEEFSVLRAGHTDQHRPDLVLFVNGIPLVVIECKSPRIKGAIDLAVEQHMRNQQEDGIRSLYQYSNLLIALSANEAKYATTGTHKEYWSIWKEVIRTRAEEEEFVEQLKKIKNEPLSSTDANLIFLERYKFVQKHFEEQELEEQKVTQQDILLYSLCRPERFLDLMYHFILYDDGVKKVARYQQYFAIKETLSKVQRTGEEGNRQGGVIWHTQGSGKSLTMVMLAGLIAETVRNPKIILVTDRIDLDDQITDTFKKCKVPVENAETGKHLVELVKSTSNAVITTIIHKFVAAVNQVKEGFPSRDIFVLVDEGHRSHYNEFHTNMRKVFPNACFVAFTGTPLMKKEKSTAEKFGGIIDIYSITDAVADGAVVPLLYEGRHNVIEVNEKPLNNYFDKVSEPLTPYGKAALKRKYSSLSSLNKAEQVIYARAWDISEHFEKEHKGTFAKGQLVAPNKLSAIKYKEYLDEIGKVTSEVIISPPDDREGEEDAFDKTEDKVIKFWKSKMDKYGKAEVYEKSIINSFKKHDEPEILIVVDKLLTGFDAPRNTVLYITRQLKEHTLLQAIARVNRLYPGKDYGYIIDYFGNLENLDKALECYSGLNGFDAEDIKDSLITVNREVEKLPQAHSDLWAIFKSVKNKKDEEAYEVLLGDEAVRNDFYNKLSLFARLLKLALSTVEFSKNTPEDRIQQYKSDAKFFLALRISVKRRYYDMPDYEEYESQIQKLIDKHITSDGEILKITELVNIFDKEKREEEVEKITGKAAKADHITSRTTRAIQIRMDEDPVFYKKLAELIKEVIDAYRQQRISEAEYLKKAKEYEETFLSGGQANLPVALRGKMFPAAMYNLGMSVFDKSLNNIADKEELLCRLALDMHGILLSIVKDSSGKLLVDWQNNRDIEGQIRLQLDDYLFDWKEDCAIDLDLNQLDEFIEETIKVAKLKITA